MARFLMVLLFLVSVSISVLGQSTHPLTFEDMEKLKRVEGPVVSPDGKWVISSVLHVDLDANQRTSRI